MVHLPQLPNSTPSLRTDRGDSQPEELLLEAAFRTRPTAAWVAALRAEGVPVEPVATPDREGFAAGFTDDPVNRQLGRVASYPTPDWGRFEQIGPLVRCGPDADATPRLMLPGVGEHTTEVLAELGLPPAEIDALLDAKIARQLAD